MSASRRFRPIGGAPNSPEFRAVTPRRQFRALAAPPDCAEVPAAITQAGNHATSIPQLKGYDAVQFYDVLASGITVDCYASGLVDVSLTFDGERGRRPCGAAQPFRLDCDGQEQSGGGKCDRGLRFTTYR